jgi:hypothetical protein
MANIDKDEYYHFDLYVTKNCSISEDGIKIGDCTVVDDKEEPVYIAGARAIFSEQGSTIDDLFRCCLWSVGALEDKKD